MKNKTFHASRLLAAVGLAAALAPFCASPSAQAALVVTNGDFETGIADQTTQADVNGWFSVTSGDFFANTWQDSRDAEVPTDAQSGFSGQAAAAFSGFAGSGQPSGLTGSWLYQSIGTDATASSLKIQFDWGDFGNVAGTLRALGLTVSVYENTGSFTGANDTDVNGASGATLLDSVSISLAAGGTPPKLALDQVVNLDISSQSGGELFLRFNNWDAGADTPWLMVDNVSIVPEPGTFAMLLGGMGMLVVFRRSRR